MTNDTSLESKENVLRLVLMVNHRFTMYLPCSAKASDNNVLSVCRGWTLSRLINMPNHAAFYGSMYSSSVIVMRLYTLHHALTVTLFFFMLSLTRTHVDRGSNSSLKALAVSQ